MNFYSETEKIDQLKRSDSPQKDWDKLRTILDGHSEFEKYFYQNSPEFGISYPSPAWAKVLYENGQFEELNGKPKFWRLKSLYLCNSASQCPKDVWEIIKNLKPVEQGIQADFLEAFLEFPNEKLPETADTVCNYLNEQTSFKWHLLSEPAAKIMVKLAKLGHIDKALKIAKILFTIKEDDSDNESYFYKESFKQFQQVLQLEPCKSLCLMFDILDDFLKSKTDNKTEADNSQYIGIGLEDLDNITESYSDKTIVFVVENICDTLKLFAKQSATQINDIIEHLGNKQKIIFKRLKLFLLRHTTDNSFLNIIKNIIKDEKYYKAEEWNDVFHYEYRYLLRDKYELLKDDVETLKPFLEWVESYSPDEDDRKRVADWIVKYRPEAKLEEEIEKIKNGYKAKKLYLLKDIDFFKERYYKYFRASGYDEQDVKPRRSIEMSEVRSVPDDENSPKSVNELKEMQVSEVMAYLADEEEYNKTNNDGKFDWQNPREGLRGAFRQTVEDKCSEYLEADIESLFKIPADFLRAYFSAIRNCSFETKVPNLDWPLFFNRIEKVLEKLPASQKFDDNYDIRRTIVNIIGKAWPKESKIDLSEQNILTILRVIEKLIKSWDSKGDKETDITQIQCNRVTSEALNELIALAVVIFKDEKLRPIYEKVYKPKYIELCDDVIQKPVDYRLCVFGMRLPQLYYTNESWLKGNIDKLLVGENWHNIWETYLVWGRPYEPLFNFLNGKGIYKKAIEALTNNEPKDNSEEKPEGRLGEHLIIAYFNSWKDAEELLKDYYEKASLKLRKHANWFFTTGFEKANNISKIKIESHWKYRLEYLKNTPKSNETISEAVKLAGWIKKCPLDNKKSLSLLSRTLDLTGGKISEDNYEPPEYIVEAICKNAKGCELLALECLLKFSSDPQLGIYSTTWKSEFIKFINDIISLPDNYSERKQIWEKTLQLLDNYGKMGIYQTKQMYFDLLDKHKSV
ncbi:MAG: hypothetical protein ACYC54_00870 [Sedimentisphaerales bacterium]